jgi:hypothetical protein
MNTIILFQGRRYQLTDVDIELGEDLNDIDFANETAIVDWSKYNPGMLRQKKHPKLMSKKGTYLHHSIS